MEQRKKLEQRARRFSAPPPAKTLSSTTRGRTVTLGTKRPSDQGLEAGDGQTAAKQMRLLASRRVVARAKVTAVQQQQNLIQQRQIVAPPQQPTRQISAPQQPGSALRLPVTQQRLPAAASQWLGTRSVQQQQQQQLQLGSTVRKTTPAITSAARPTPQPISDVSYCSSLT